MAMVAADVMIKNTVVVSSSGGSGGSCDADDDDDGDGDNGRVCPGAVRCGRGCVVVAIAGAASED